MRMSNFLFDKSKLDLTKFKSGWDTFVMNLVDELHLRFESWEEIEQSAVFQELDAEFSA